jgi:hypothetical protein
MHMFFEEQQGTWYTSAPVSSLHTWHATGMAKPQEVADNVAVLLDMAGSHDGAAETAESAEELALAGKDAADNVEQQEQLNNSNSITASDSSVMSDKSGGAAGRPEKGVVGASAAGGFSADEAAVLAKIRRVLQPVKDVTWPVGLTDNRK